MSLLDMGALPIQDVESQYLPPVSRLPTELLIDIFRYHIPGPWTLVPRKGLPPTWIAISHVCRRWREIAIGYPHLWANIILSNRSWTTAMLERSKPLPIVISAAFEGRPLRAALLDALSQVSRARELVLEVTMLHHLLESFKDQPAPSLESLRLVQSVGMSPCVLPDDVFGGHTPVLQELELDRVTIQWSSSLLRPRLTHLEIRNPHRDFLPSMTQMLDVLATMSHLDTLILSNALPPCHIAQHFDITNPNRTLPLPSVTKLHLVGTPGECSQFLNRVMIPVDAELIFECIHFPSTRDLTLIIDLIENAITRHMMAQRQGEVQTRAGAIESMSIGFSHNRKAWLVAGPAHPPSTFLPSGKRTARIALSLQWNVDYLPVTETETLFSRLCTLPSFTNVESLRVQGFMFTAAEKWRAALANMKSVSQLLVYGHAAYGFGRVFNPGNMEDSLPETLERSPDDHGEPGPLSLSGEDHRRPAPLFPALKSLRVERVDFYASTLPTNLLEGIAARNQSGPLEKLVVRDCDISELDVSQLRKSGVRSFEWDGVDVGLSTIYRMEHRYTIDLDR